jgi:hypothetical protein
MDEALSNPALCPPPRNACLCSHSAHVTGLPLRPGCTGPAQRCAAEMAIADPFCAFNSWDSLCVQEALRSNCEP